MHLSRNPSSLSLVSIASLQSSKQPFAVLPCHQVCCDYSRLIRCPSVFSQSAKNIHFRVKQSPFSLRDSFPISTDYLYREFLLCYGVLQRTYIVFHFPPSLQRTNCESLLYIIPVVTFEIPFIDKSSTHLLLNFLIKPPLQP